MANKRKLTHYRIVSIRTNGNTVRTNIYNRLIPHDDADARAEQWIAERTAKGETVVKDINVNWRRYWEK